MKPAIATMLILALLGGHVSRLPADDWPMLGRDHTRNAVSPETNPPVDWDIGDFDRKTGQRTGEGARNIRWVAKLGYMTGGDPVIADGLVWVGTNNFFTDFDHKTDDASVLACFRESDGELLYKYISPRLGERNQDWPHSSIACSPLIDGDRLWFITNRWEVVCLDINPLKRRTGEPRVVWKCDMIDELGVYPNGGAMHYSRHSSVAAYGDHVFVVTGNGAYYSRTVPAPEAPSLVCLSKDTGEVIWKDNSPGVNILDCQWASPLVAEIAGRVQVIVPQGDGWVRSFDALSGELFWEYDVNPKTSRWHYGHRSDRNIILATPVLYEERVYVAVGQHPQTAGEGLGRLCCIDASKTGDISKELAVNAKGQRIPHRRLQAVDPEQGEKAIPNPNSGLSWEYTEADQDGDGKIEFEEAFHRTVSSVAIKDGLLIAVDFSGLAHCLDARSGKMHWSYDLCAASLTAPLIVGGHIYLADQYGDVSIFRLSADPRQAMRDGEPINADGRGNVANVGTSIYASPVFANGTLYVASRSHLFAIKGEESEELPASQELGHWPQWRGPNRDNLSTETGLLKEWPEGGPPLVREVKGIGIGIGSLAVAGGKVYALGYLNDSEYVTALDELTGQREWITRIGPAVAEASTMRWLSQRTPTVDRERLYAFTSHGELICLATAGGKELWRKSYVEDFGTSRHPWGLCDYPLVDGDHLICAPGGTDATMVALDKVTGEEVWRSKFDATTDWSGINVCSAAGIRQYVLYLGNKLCGIAADDGRLLWTNEEVAMGRNYTTPILHENLVFCGTSSGGGGGGIGLLRLSPDGNGVTATTEYFHPRTPPSSFSDSAVLHGEHVYLLRNPGMPSCVELETGKVVWQTRIAGGHRGDSWVFADGRLYLRQVKGSMRLVEATPAGYLEKSSFDIPGHAPSLGATMPVVAGGHLYLRDDDRLLCYDVRAERASTAKSAPDKIRLAAPASRSADRLRPPRSVFVPTPSEVVAEMLALADVKQADVVYDLGSGDGRIVIAAAKRYGSRAVGYEIDTELVQLSREAAETAGVGQLVTIQHKDIFTADLSKADVVALYLVPQQLEALLPQLQKLKPGSRIVSHQFQMPDVEPDQVITLESTETGDRHTLYLWTTPLKAAPPKPE